MKDCQLPSDTTESFYYFKFAFLDTLALLLSQKHFYHSVGHSPHILKYFELFQQLCSISTISFRNRRRRRRGVENAHYKIV